MATISILKVHHKDIPFLLGNMKSLLIFAGLFSIALFASIIDARKDPGEYWEGVKQNEPMPELVQGLVDVSKVTSVSTKENHCDNSITSRNFEPRPNVSAYNENGKLKEEKSFAKDFEPRPNVSAYNDDSKLKGTKAHTKDFEPRPNVSAYNDDVEPKDKKSFTNNFEPRPNVSAYTDDAKWKPFIKDFEPRPSATGYTDDYKLKVDKSFVKDCESRPDIPADNDDAVGDEAKKAFEKDFQPQPNVSV